MFRSLCDLRQLLQKLFVYLSVPRTIEMAISVSFVCSRWLMGGSPPDSATRIVLAEPLLNGELKI
jgi:hypothetical protein